MNKTAFQWMITPLQNYANFSGRAPRAEYWWFILFTTLVGFVLGIIDAAAGFSIGVFGGLFNLAILLPSLAVGVRRMHDIGRSGWWVLMPVGVLFGTLALVLAVAGTNALTDVSRLNPVALGVVGILGALLVLGAVVVQFVWFCTRGQQFTNKWGPDPYGPQNVAEDFA